jgi:TPR repeat protein
MTTQLLIEAPPVAEIVAERAVIDSDRGSRDNTIMSRPHHLLLAAALALLAPLAACEPDRAPFEKACDAGDGAACLRLGEMLVKGVGGPMNKRKADDLLGRACDRGDAAACAFGGDVAYARDDAASRRMLLSACRGGHLESCVGAAWMLRNGEGGSADEAGADEILERACGKGCADACFFLGLAREADGGSGGAAPFARACALGDPVACGRVEP